MSNLLQIVRWHPQSVQRKGVAPLIVEFNVDPGTAPYLVSSSSAVMWIDEPHPGGIVKAAVRQIQAPAELFREALDAVCARSVKDQWGSVHPFTADGVRAAVAHLESYDLEDLEAIVPRVRDSENSEGAMQRPDWIPVVLAELDLMARTASWIPDDCVVIVPRNRDFVGVMGHLDPRRVAMLIHNAGRGIGVARGTHLAVAA